MRRKNVRGIAGVTVGLIAALIFISVVVPLLINYLTTTLRKYEMEKYSIEYRKIIELEKESISACYDDSGIIYLNNTLGSPIYLTRILVETNGEVYFEKLKKEHQVLSPTETLTIDLVNEYGIANIGDNAIIKILTVSGGIITVPPCSSIINIVGTGGGSGGGGGGGGGGSVPPPSNIPSSTIYFDESTYPVGIGSTEWLFGVLNVGSIFLHAPGNRILKIVEQNDENSTIILQGTTIPDECKAHCYF